MEEVVRLVDLPFGVVSLVMIDEDGIANIYLNARMNDEMRRRGYEHEHEHIRRDDWNSTNPVEQIEREVRSAV